MYLWTQDLWRRCHISSPLPVCYSPLIFLKYWKKKVWETSQTENLILKRTLGGEESAISFFTNGSLCRNLPKNAPTTIAVFILNAVRSRLFMPLVGSELKNNINKPRSNRSFSGHGSSRIFTWRPANVSSSNTPECPSLQLQPVIAEPHLCLYLSLDSPEQDFNSHSERRVQTDM